MVGSEDGCNNTEEYDLEPPPFAPYKSNEEDVGGEDGCNSQYGSNSQYSDFLVDEENMLDDPEVDMNDFILNIDDNVEWIGEREIVEADKELCNEELEVINNEMLVSDSSEEEGYNSRRRNKIRAVERARANDTTMVKDHFYIFQRFSSPEEVKERIYLHAIETRRELQIVKNDKQRIRVTCKGTIPNLGILETCGVGEGGSKKNKAKVKENTVNKCPWVLLTVKTYVKEHLETNPEIPIRALKEQLERKYGVNISDMKTFRAKSKALDTIRGDFGGQFAILRDYLQDLQTKNPDTTVKLVVESEPNVASETRVFKRVYVCLGPLKRGFAAGKRDLLGLDGAFLKGPYPGQVLTVVGLDGNNCTYPLAYAIVEAENISSWTWFLDILGDDLQLYSNSNFTFISDRQKGVQVAVSKLVPQAEHRFCLRHIHENMKIKWRGEEFKDFLWKAATASTVPQFSVAMEELRQLNNASFEWLKKIPPKHWARAVFCGNDKYQVSGHGLEQFVVDMKQKTCSCYRWELTGMPCKHTIAAIWDMRRNNEAVGIPENWVHPT
ncbi:hypothetical protein LXL04_030233 [Taraxacum kok-saghyz]